MQHVRVVVFVVFGLGRLRIRFSPFEAPIIPFKLRTCPFFRLRLGRRWLWLCLLRLWLLLLRLRTLFSVDKVPEQRRFDHHVLPVVRAVDHLAVDDVRLVLQLVVRVVRDDGGVFVGWWWWSTSSGTTVRSSLGGCTLSLLTHESRGGCIHALVKGEGRVGGRQRRLFVERVQVRHVHGVCGGKVVERKVRRLRVVVFFFFDGWLGWWWWLL